MPCEHFKDALIEAAAGGLLPQGGLRAHLAACASCREAFSQEQSLFAAIDSGLHAAANTEVPPSLLPRVRAGLEAMPVAPSRWTPGWFGLAGAALVAATLLVAVIVRQNRVGTPPVHSVENRPTVPAVLPPTPSPLPLALSPRRDAIPRPSLRAASAPVRPEHAAATQSVPEVLVPRDQEVLLASYAQEWSSRKRAPLIANEAKPADVALLDVPPIQITELDVKPLAEGDSQ
jgi:hypothetical protein